MSLGTRLQTFDCAVRTGTHRGAYFLAEEWATGWSNHPTPVSKYRSFFLTQLEKEKFAI